MFAHASPPSSFKAHASLACIGLISCVICGCTPAPAIWKAPRTPHMGCAVFHILKLVMLSLLMRRGVSIARKHEVRQTLLGKPEGRFLVPLNLASPCVRWNLCERHECMGDHQGMYRNLFFKCSKTLEKCVPRVGMP